MDTLAKCRTRKQVKQALDTLPLGLYETYDRILDSINEQDSQLVRRLLLWLTFPPFPPLTIDQLAEAVALDPDSTPPFDDENIIEDPEDILRMCGSLVTRLSVRGAEGRVVLAHYSVKEYLTSEHLTKKHPEYSYTRKDAKIRIAMACLQGLLHGEALLQRYGEALPDAQRNARNGILLGSVFPQCPFHFLDYAMECWWKCTSSIRAPDPDLRQLLKNYVNTAENEKQN
jgi:hypothetical protein